MTQANVNTVNQLSRDAFGKSLGESSQLEESVNHFISDHGGGSSSSNNGDIESNSSTTDNNEQHSDNSDDESHGSIVSSDDDNDDNGDDDDGGDDDGDDDDDDDDENRAGQNGDQLAVNPTVENFKLMLRENYSHRIDAPVVASRGNALLMVLEMAKQNSDTVKGFIDSANLVNSLFATPVLPTSKFIMDKLLRIDMGIEKHYYCPNCKHELGIFQDGKSLKCTKCHPVEENTEDSEKERNTNENVEHFVIFNLVTQLEIVLKKLFKLRVKLFKPSDALDREAGHFKDLYDGSVYKKFARDFDKEDVKVISFTICTDGSPIFKSSALSIWPIFVMINELPPGPRFSNLLLGGLWFGKSHPDMKLFLTPFTRKLTNMSFGFTIIINAELQWKVEIYLLGCCVDSGARGAVQFISTHGGYLSCNWSEIPGIYIFGAVRYPMMPDRPPLRTCESLIENGKGFTAALATRQRLPTDRLERAALFKGAKGVTPLAESDSFDPVGGFILEHAHCVYLGIVRNYASIWHAMLNNKRGNDREDKLKLLNDRLQSLHPPIEVRRLPRILEERVKWNAKECENFLLFYSIPALQGLIPFKYVKHWFLLVQALHLLLRNDVTLEDCNTARTLLCHYCCDIQELYGEQELTFNCHLLTHLCEHVLRWDPLWAISGMAFEDGNGVLKRKIKAAKGIPNQIHRNLWQECALDIIREEFSSNETKVFCNSLRSKQLLKKGVFTPSCNFMGKSVKLQPSARES
ncbi:Halomucin [Frankliniella fusca]|uniref:Halomucin n=1 Tax=Frankliniella fusca TaxID=407009 RepID=A0AAE1HXJ8_9NEOP|nr:Halomucin [Frankliniella fusca]